MIVNNVTSGFSWYPELSTRAKRIYALAGGCVILALVSAIAGWLVMNYQINYDASVDAKNRTAYMTLGLVVVFMLGFSFILAYMDRHKRESWAISGYDTSRLNRLEAVNKYWMERGLDGEYIGQNDLSSRGVWTPKASGAGAGGVYGVWTHHSGLRLRRVSYSQLSLDERTIRFHQTEYLELSLDGRGKDNDTTVLTLTRDRDQEPVCSVVDDFDRVLLWPVLRAFEDELGSFTQNDIESAAYQIRMAILNAGRMAKINA